MSADFLSFIRISVLTIVSLYIISCSSGGGGTAD